MNDKRKRHRVFHINMLKKWHVQPETAFSVQDLPEVDQEDEVQVWNCKEKGSEDMPKINGDLTHIQCQEIQALLEEFPDVLSAKPGRTALTKHTIITKDATPVKLPSYRLPHAYRDTVRSELKEMMNSGIIEDSNSDWASPIVLVKKKDGSLRLCVDYRRLNAVTRADAYPMPRVDDLIDQLGKARFISTLDLTKGYWQVPMSEESRSKTAFTAPFELFQFTVMPFGLCGAPATFQRMMDQLLRGTEEYAMAYLDDLVIYSCSWENHLQHLRSILDKL